MFTLQVDLKISSHQVHSRNKKKMEFLSSKFNVVVVLALLSALNLAVGIRFVIDKEECFSHEVAYEGDTVHVSFVVIKAEGWHHSGDGTVDLVVKGPSGYQIHDSRDKTSDKFEFVAHTKGLHKFCFTNKSPYHETIDFDIHVGHLKYFDEHAKGEHFNPLLEKISMLTDDIWAVHFDQSVILSRSYRRRAVDKRMSKNALHKAIFQSAALVGASVLQVYLLRRLFEKKLGTSRV